MTAMASQKKHIHANIAVFVPHNGCPHTCSFCNQRTISGHTAQPSPREVAEILESDLERLQSKGGSHEGRELAFFGGSFTAIDRDYMISLLAAAQPYIGKSISGIRCSTRPDCIDDDILDILMAYGVTAIELGAQSMDDRVLEFNHRGHTAAQVEQASERIRSRGIELGLQMMTGLYGDTDEGARITAQRLAELNPATVRIYPTVVLEGTELGRLFSSGEYVPQTLGQAVELCADLLEFFEEKGIRVIRLGLHASPDVEQSYLAGAYHPALRELAEGRIFLRRMTERVNNDPQITGFGVNPRDLSKALGQHRANLEELRRYNPSLRIIASGDAQAGEIRPLYAEENK